jgi:hypothetical protein
MKKIVIYFTLVMMLALTACMGNAAASFAVDSVEIAAANTEVESAAPTLEAVATPEVEYDPEDLDIAPVDADTATLIELKGDTISTEGPGASVNGSTVTISAAGTYQVSGILNDGQIIVDTTDTENVTLILTGVDITSKTSAPIYVANAEKMILTLAAGSENIVTDGDTYLALDEGGEPNDAVFSKDDLTINGEGALTVNANYNNGIASKDDLKITGSTITVNAANDGIKVGIRLP